MAFEAITCEVFVTSFYLNNEKQSIQLRFEGFNLPNHVNPGPPNGLSGNGTATSTAGLITSTAAFNNPSFGKILSSDDPRISQGALKFVF